jgi:hypothetical protein
VVALYPNLVLNPKRLSDIAFELLNSLTELLVALLFGTSNAESFVKRAFERFGKQRPR